MPDSNYLKKLVKSRKKMRTKDISDELAEREVNTLFNLLKHFYQKDFNESTNVVVDIGCGDGYLKKCFEKKKFKYLGYDVEDLDIEKDKLPVEDRSVDIVINIGLIEALKDYKNLMSESYRVLRPNGFFYTITPNWHKDYKNFYNNPIHKKPYTPNSLKQALEINNFNSVKILPGLRSKPMWYYKGYLRFEKAYFLLPFNRYDFKKKKYYSNNFIRRLIPEFLKGHSRSIIAIAKK